MKILVILLLCCGHLPALKAGPHTANENQDSVNFVSSEELWAGAEWKKENWAEAPSLGTSSADVTVKTIAPERKDREKGRHSGGSEAAENTNSGDSDKSKTKIGFDDSQPKMTNRVSTASTDGQQSYFTSQIAEDGSINSLLVGAKPGEGERVTNPKIRFPDGTVTNLREEHLKGIATGEIQGATLLPIGKRINPPDRGPGGKPGGG